MVRDRLQELHSRGARQMAVDDDAGSGSQHFSTSVMRETNVYSNGHRSSTGGGLRGYAMSAVDEPLVHGDGHSLYSLNVNDKSDQLHDFLESVEHIGNDINMLDTYVLDLKYKHSQMLVNAHVDQKIKSDVDGIMSAFTQLAKNVRHKLAVLDKDTEDYLSEVGAEEQTSSVRIRTTQHAYISQRLHQVLVEYNQEQAVYRDKCKARIQQFNQITDADYSDEQVDDMIESGTMVNNILLNSSRAKSLLDDVRARQEDIAKLERNIRELHELFVDLGHMVECQGEMVDSIAYNVSLAVDHATEAQSQVRQAKKARDAHRRKKVLCVILVVFTVVVLLFVAGVYIETMIPW